MFHECTISLGDQNSKLSVTFFCDSTYEFYAVNLRAKDWKFRDLVCLGQWQKEGRKI